MTAKNKKDIEPKTADKKTASKKIAKKNIKKTAASKQSLNQKSKTKKVSIDSTKEFRAQKDIQKKGILKVIVASKNPVKIKATLIAFEKMFPEFEISCIGEQANSNVSDQPMTSDETLYGARNRINNVKLNFPDADYWVGIEGGINPYEDTYMTFPWIVVSSKKYNYESRILGSNFILPKKIAVLLDEGHELGKANDIVFDKENSKQKSGSVGCLTNDNITRTDYYVSPLMLALIPFKNPKLYELSIRQEGVDQFII